MILRSSIAASALAVLSAGAFAQGWAGECLDPMNTAPYSTPFIVNGPPTTPLIGAIVGGGGTVTYGGTTGPCYGPTARTLENQGRFAFGIPGGGSVQNGFDNGLALTMGWPTDPVGDYTYAMMTTGENPNTGRLFGENAIGFFGGASKRYAIFATTVVDTGGATVGQCQLEIKILADAARMRWRFFNTGATTNSFGLIWVYAPWMRSGGTDHFGFNQANTNVISASGIAKDVDRYMGYISFDDGMPIRTEKKREQTDPNFPKQVRALFGQTEAYGTVLDNGPTASTPDASIADFVKVGAWSQTGINNTVNFNLYFDPTGTVDDNDWLLSNGAPHGGAQIVQRFNQTLVQAGGFSDIVHYIRGPWSTGSYTDPYTVVLDAPRAIHYAAGAQNLGPQPMQIRAWIDNQYATIDREVPLVNVSVRINLPAGLSLGIGETQVKNFATILPNQLQAIDWNVVSDGETYGDLPISITVNSTPGPSKTISTSIRIAAKPTMSFVAGPNMVTFPYSFGSSTLDSILGLTSGVDYVAYGWDPLLRAYVPTTNVQRGVGTWVIPNNAINSFDLLGANLPGDIDTGGTFVNLQPGWNLIGNPYNYGVPVNQLFGVPEDNNVDSMTWQQMVQSEYVSSALTYFQPNGALPGGGSYVITPSNPVMEPHRAYWLFVRAARPVRLIWPPLFQETLPNAARSNVVERFAQSDREWRLQLSARSTNGFDAENYIGVVTDRNKAKLLQLPKAPEAPGAQLELAVIAEFMGQPTRMAQSISDRQGKQEYKLQVKSESTGDVTVTWPNLPSLPRNLRAKIVDDLTGDKRDLRASSGYTFRMDQPGTRTFTIQVEPSGNSRPTIGNVIVQPSSRENNSPMVINYSLSADALVTVRILSSTGKEVYMVTRSRADNAGENSATWTLKDNANRAVAPGTYKVEILAETPNGERVRKIVPVNVIR